MFEDAKEELPEQIDTALHEVVFRNDLPEISALLRAAKERSQVRITCNIKCKTPTYFIISSIYIQHSTFYFLHSTIHIACFGKFAWGNILVISGQNCG